MSFSSNPRRLFACAAGTFFVVNVLCTSVTLEHFVASAPENMRRFMRLSGYISAVLTPAGTLVVYVLAGAFTWAMATLAGVELSQASLARAGAWLLGLACVFQFARFFVSEVYLFPRVAQLALVGAEKFSQFVKEGIHHTPWQTRKDQLDMAFLAAAPLAFGGGLARSEDEAAWAKGVLGAVSVGTVLVVVAVAGAALR